MMRSRGLLPLVALLPALVVCNGGGGGSGDASDTAITGASQSSTEATTSSSSTQGGSATETAGTTAATASGTETGVIYDVASNADVGPSGTACQMAEAALSNTGCEFWAVDLPNAWMVQASPAPEDQPYAIVAVNTATDPANVSIFAGAEQVALKSATIPAASLYVFTFDNTYGTKNRENSYGTAYRLESDIPVTVYQFNPLDNSTQVFSNDATIVFPSHVLARDYTAITGDGTRLGFPMDFNAGAFITVAATVDDTEVTFFPPKDIKLYPGDLTVTLKRGQTYTLMSNAVESLFQNIQGQGNLSGTRIRADNAVAVFSGNVASFEPTPQNGCCADHLEHQMLPLTAWASKYVVVAAPPNLGGEEDMVRVRVTGSFDGTQLTYTPSAPPGAPLIISAYQTVAFNAPKSLIIASDKPFAVTEFLLSNEVVTVDPTPEDDADDGTWPGDPAMILVPPTAQYQSEYIFFVPAEYAKNHVTIVRPAGATVALDGVDVTGDSAWGDVGAVDGVTWQRGHFPLTFGPHRVDAGEDKVGIIVTGYDTAVSFGYAGGSGVEFIGQPPQVPPS
ncbi:MAG: IgGFc-binding protein [Nannocystaceae bacterium]